MSVSAPVSARRDAAAHRRVEEPGAGRPDRVRDATGSCRAGRCSCRRGRRRRGRPRRARPAPANDRPDGGVVGEHRDRHVGRRGRLGRRVDDPAADLVGEGIAALAGSGSGRSRRGRPGRGRGPSRCPSAPCRRSRPSSSPAYFASSSRRWTVSTIRSTVGIAASSRTGADGSGMCGVVIRTSGASRL